MSLSVILPENNFNTASNVFLNVKHISSPDVTRLSLYLVVDVQQHQVVSSGHHKVHSGVVGVHYLVFGTVEDRVVYRQHGRDRQHFLRTFVPGEKKQMFPK